MKPKSGKLSFGLSVESKIKIKYMFKAAKFRPQVGKAELGFIPSSCFLDKLDDGS